MSKMICERDFVTEAGHPDGHRGMVVGIVKEKMGVRLAAVRWQNGITTHQSFDTLTPIGNALPGSDPRFSW